MLGRAARGREGCRGSAHRLLVDPSSALRVRELHGVLENLVARELDGVLAADRVPRMPERGAQGSRELIRTAVGRDPGRPRAPR